MKRVLSLSILLMVLLLLGASGRRDIGDISEGSRIVEPTMYVPEPTDGCTATFPRSHCA